MPFMVIYSTSDGSSCHEQADAIDEAALFVERLRNQEGDRGDPHLPDGGDQLRLPAVLQGRARDAGAAVTSSPPPEVVRHAAACRLRAADEPSPSSPVSRVCRPRRRPATPPERAVRRGRRPSRRQRPTGPVRPLTPPGHPSAWSISAGQRHGEHADRRRRPRPRADEQRARAARRIAAGSSHGRSPRSATSRTSTICRLSPRLERRPRS